MRILAFFCALVFALVIPAFSGAEEIILGGTVAFSGRVPESQARFFSSKTHDRISEAGVFVWDFVSPGSDRNLSGMRFPNGVAAMAGEWDPDDLAAKAKKYGIPAMGDRQPQSSGVFARGDYTVISAGSRSGKGGISLFSIKEMEKALAKPWNKDFKGTVIAVIHDAAEGNMKKAIIRKMASLGVDILVFPGPRAEPFLHGKTLVVPGLGDLIPRERDNNDVRLLSVDPETKRWKWLCGMTRNHVFMLK